MQFVNTNKNQFHLEPIFGHKLITISPLHRKDRKPTDTMRPKYEVPLKKIDPSKIINLDTSDISQFMSCGGMKLQKRNYLLIEKRKSREKIKKFHFSSPDPNVYKKTHNDQKIRRAESLPKSQFNLNRVLKNISSCQNAKKAKDLKAINPSNLILKKQMNGNTKTKELTAFYTKQNSYCNLYKYQDDELPLITHTNILSAYGWVQFDLNKHKYFVCELNQGSSLKSLLHQFDKFEEHMVKILLRQIVQAVYFMHANRFAHNRLSLESLSLDKLGHIYINNFKSSTKPLSEYQKNAITHFFPPEMLLSNNFYNSEKNDIWAIGCLTLQMLSQKSVKFNPFHPYNKHTRSENGDNILTDSCSLIERVQTMLLAKNSKNEEEDSQELFEPCDLSALCLDFITKCMMITVEKRPNIDQIMLHPFLKR